ncbi:MAG: polymer-forming cytoskeletal protein, partial [Nitrosospira sp.]
MGADTQIEGNLQFQGGLRIDGRVTGNVTQLGDKPST